MKVNGMKGLSMEKAFSNGLMGPPMMVSSSKVKNQDLENSTLLMVAITMDIGSMESKMELVLYIVKMELK